MLDLPESPSSQTADDQVTLGQYASIFREVNAGLIETGRLSTHKPHEAINRDCSGASCVTAQSALSTQVRPEFFQQSD